MKAQLHHIEVWRPGSEKSWNVSSFQKLKQIRGEVRAEAYYVCPKCGKVTNHPGNHPGCPGYRI